MYEGKLLPKYWQLAVLLEDVCEVLENIFTGIAHFRPV